MGTPVAESRPSLGTGERIGAYRIEKLLGRGGMGEVFLARDDRLKRCVAIKRIRHDRTLDPALRRRLLREARAAAGLSHPAIVQIFDLLEDESGDCLILEYVEGKTLAATLAAGPLDTALALRLAREIAGGLAAAHAAGIIHRDLKADNVIVTPTGHAKVLDFGLAHMQAQTTDDILLTQHGVLLGTFHMMSPEQARGCEVDERSDLFSLGILLYEMVTGHSPFKGSSPVETLNRVTSVHPTRADILHPGVPPRLATLIEHLLAKDPDARPASAGQVEQELEILGTSPYPSSADSVSDLPTAVEVRLDDITRALPRSSKALPSTAGMSALPRRGFYREIAIAAALAVFGAAIYYLLQHQPEEPSKPVKPVPVKILRVVVPKPQVEGDDERLALAASGVLTASLNTLGSLEGVAAVDPLQLVGSPKSPAEMARAAAADEVVVWTLEKADNLGRITVRRIRGSDGSVLWTDNFDASIGAQDLRLLAEVVGIHLRRGFPKARPRPGTPALDVRNGDYAEFLAIKQRIDSGQIPAGSELEHLERIVESSPHFLEAHLLASQASFNLFQSTREAAYRDRALAFLRSAQELAPGDPSLLQVRFRIELDGDLPEVAAATLARFEELLPGDPQAFVMRSRFAERKGRIQQALADQRTATERLRTWRNLKRLADLEARNGRVEDAREHLKEILLTSPGNVWALEALANVELIFGDPRRAERIYLDLTARAPQSRYFSGLGGSRFLLGRPEDAVAAFWQALTMDPDNAYTTLNLADAELSLGRTREAEAHYRLTLQTLERDSPPGGLKPDDSMVQAQCLAHLGHTQEAAEITRKVLGQTPGDPYLLQSAALVYTLAGDRASALANAQKALEKGLQPNWFNLPAFAPLKDDPKLQRLLRKKWQARAPDKDGEAGDVPPG